MTIEFRPIKRQLLTGEQAAEYLQLSENGSDGVRALRRYVGKKLIHPTKIGRSNKFSIAELDRFIATRTEPHDA